MRTRQKKIELKTKDLFYFLLKYMIHNMLVSGVQQKDSEYMCVCVHTYTFFSYSFPLYVIRRN